MGDKTNMIQGHFINNESLLPDCASVFNHGINCGSYGGYCLYDDGDYCIKCSNYVAPFQTTITTNVVNYNYCSLLRLYNHTNYYLNDINIDIINNSKSNCYIVFNEFKIYCIEVDESINIIINYPLLAKGITTIPYILTNEREISCNIKQGDDIITTNKLFSSYK